MAVHLMSILRQSSWSIPSSYPLTPTVVCKRKRRATSGEKLQPAKSIIELLGGPNKVSEITDCELSRVYRWMYPVSRGGTGGHVPDRQARKLLAYSNANGMGLSPSDFFLTEGDIGDLISRPEDSSVTTYGEVYVERMRRNLSQVEAAAEAGVSQATLCRWDNGAEPNKGLYREALDRWLSSSRLKSAAPSSQGVR